MNPRKIEITPKSEELSEGVFSEAQIRTDFGGSGHCISYTKEELVLLVEELERYLSSRGITWRKPAKIPDDLNAILATHKWCFYINPSQNPQTHGGYVPSIVIASEGFHRPLMGRGEGASPWVWGKTLTEAEEVCRKENLERGISEKDAFRIVASSMSASKVSQ